MARLTFNVLKALSQAKYAKRILPIVRPIAAFGDAYDAFHYAESIIHGPFPEGEKAIAKDAVYAYRYAYLILKGPFPEGEKAIANCEDDDYYIQAYMYAKYVLDGPFPLGEPVIARSDNAYAYAKYILGLDAVDAALWGEEYRNG